MKAMIVKIIIGAAVMWAAIPLTVHGMPTAGYCEMSSLPNYENPTQWVFENKGLWPEPEPDKSPIKSVEALKPTETQKAFDFTPHEVLKIKQVIQAECGFNQPTQGVVAVTDVILNRVRSGKFPDNPIGVISQPYQFSTWWNGMVNDQKVICGQVDKVVDYELKHGPQYPGLLYFTAGEYNEHCTPWGKIGDHYFGY